MFLYIALIWGSSFILMKRAESNFPPMSLATYRLFGAAAILFVFWLIGSRSKLCELKDLKGILFMAVCTVIPFAAQPFLIARYGSGFIGMMVIFVPLLTILISVPMLKKYPNAREIIGVLGGFFFTWLIIKDGIDRDFSFTDMLLAFSIPFTYALSNTFTKRYLNHVKPLNLSAAVMLMAALLIWPLSVIMEDVIIDGNFCVENGYSGIYFISAADMVISNNVCRDNNYGAGGASNSGITVGEAVHNVKITGNNCYDSRAGGSQEQAHGIYIVSSTAASAVHNIDVTNNRCYNNDQ